MLSRVGFLREPDLSRQVAEQVRVRDRFGVRLFQNEPVVGAILALVTQRHLAACTGEEAAWIIAKYFLNFDARKVQYI